MIHRTTPAAYKLLHDGTLALAAVERWGVRVDMGYVDAELAKTAAKIADMEAELKSDKTVYPILRRTYGGRLKLGSRPQIAHAVFDILGHKSRGRTATGRKRADRGALEVLDLPFVKTFLKCEELKKARSTYLVGIKREAVWEPGTGWVVHPSYNLNTVATFRSSCDHPNFQNNPVRNPEIAALVRPAYIPRRGNHFGEPDYAQVEVKLAAVYNRDPVLIRYCKDKTTDMHRDMAAEIFMIAPAVFTRALGRGEKWAKALRHIAKNKFVFPQFYGDFYPRCAASMWEAAVRQNLTIGEGGPSVIEHLRTRGIKKLGKCDPDESPVSGTFEHHVMRIEDDFWNKRFRVYTEWKQSWWRAYQRDGGFSMLTGFAVNGPHSRNDVINYPVQGAAFHCLLWSLIELVAEIKRHRMKTRIVGEVHDSFQFDGPRSELDGFLNLTHEVMTERIVKHWPWLDVPLEVEVEVSPRGESWFNKKVWEEHEQHWSPKA